MEIIKDYWVQLIFFCTLLLGFYKYSKSMIEAVKCSLRNDVLAIYDECKEEKKITKYQLDAIRYSYELYKKLNGNSFVDTIYEKVQKYEIVD